MFKTAATKIAHNSTIPALGGNQDLRPLQDLITAEKALLTSLQKLSVDYSKASEALRTWGLSEGDDLGDILSASTSILNHFSAALSQYATHGHGMREQLKAIRTREESLDELKRRRRTLLRKTEDADKKLSKMGSEHKNLAIQTETLHRLREEIRTMDSDIMSEEAALGDFKRTATRMWMGLKFGGLLECCEKGTIAGEYGKLVIAEISEEITQPGLPRSLYYGHTKVESLVAEAHRCVNEVTLSTVLTVGPRDRAQYDQNPLNPPSAAPQIGYGEPPDGGTRSSGDLKLQPPPLSTLPDDGSSYLQTPIRTFAQKPDSSSLNLSLGSNVPPYQPQLSQGTFNSSVSQTLPSSHQFGVNKGAVDDFGAHVRSTGPLNNSNNAGGRFATFPVKTRPPGSSGGYSLQDSPSLGGRHPADDSSFSASIVEALHEKEDSMAGSLLSPWGNRFNGGNGGSEPSIASEGTTRATEGSYHQSTYSSGGRSDNDPPPFEKPSVAVPSSKVPPDNNKHSSLQFSYLPPPPPGAAPPDLGDSWLNPIREGPFQAPSHSRQPSQLSDNDEALLAYMDGDSGIQESLPTTSSLSIPPTSTTLSAPTTNKEDQSSNRHVRFGTAEDINQEIEKRVSLEKEQAPNVHTVAPSLSLEGQQPTTTLDKGRRDSGERNSTESTSDSLQQTKPTSQRVPPPAMGQAGEDEKALDAAAAREISSELEALKNNNQNQPPSQADQHFQPDPTPDFDRGRTMTASTPLFNDYRGAPTTSTAAGGRDASPISTSSRGRNLVPHPYAELHPTATQSYAQQPYQSPSVSPAQAYAQSYQQQQQQQPQQPSSFSSYVPFAQSQAPEMRSNLPPRFQALNNSMAMDPQVPPRFQNSSSSTVSSLPPRFQTSHSPQVSALGGVNIPDQQQRGDIIPPTAYSRPLGSTSPLTKSSTTPSPIRNPPMGSTPPLNINTGARTINAAAFKRPVQRNPGSMDNESTIGKKALPNSPYPLRDTGATTSSPGGALSVQGSGPGQQQQQQLSEIEDNYDYISAYVNNSTPSSPQRMDSGPWTSGQGRI